MTTGDVVKITVLLLQQGTTDKDTGSYAYAKGWSDLKIRDAANIALEVKRITELRRAHFGRILSEEVADRLPNDPRTLTEVYQELTNRLGALERMIEDLTKPCT